MLKRLAFLIALFTLNAFANPTLTDIFETELPDAVVGMVVMDAQNGEVIYSRNPHMTLTPASTTKLLTSLVALKTLGPDYRFETSVLLNPEFIQNETYLGDIFIRFGGDPALTRTQLQALLIDALKSKGIKHIQGNLVIDQHAFEGPDYARGWLVDDIPWYFAAPVNAAIVDENHIPLKLTPPTKLGQPVQITSSDKNISVHTDVVAVTKEEAETLCQLNVTLPKPNEVYFEGCWPVNNPLKTLKVANQFPVETLSTGLSQTLQGANIKLDGSIISGATPNTYQAVKTQASPALKDLLKPVLQDSNNLYTETLTKAIGGTVEHRPTFQAGTYVIQDYLGKEYGLNQQEIVLFDGSGLSSQNLISPDILAQLLFKAYHDESVKSHFLDALAVNGESGSLKYRLSDPSQRNLFLGKTGGMTHVSSLAGFYQPQSERPLVFVIMLNHSAHKKLGELKGIEDSILIKLAKRLNSW